MPYYGIDLGTSNCLMARIDEGFEDGEFEIKCLRDSDMNEEFPSVVSFINQNEYVVGEQASRRLSEYPDSTVELIKIRLGNTDAIRLIVQGSLVEKSPQEITSLLLKHLVSSRGGCKTSPVLTVPAFFDQSQKNATKEAGELAIIKAKQLIEEPTAAILYQIFAEYQKNPNTFQDLHEKNVLVFDFGGGTLDLSVIHLEFYNGIVQPTVLGTGGDNTLGGNLIDFQFTNTVIKILNSAYPTDNFIQQLSTVFEKYYYNYLQHGILSFETGTPENIKNYIYILKRHLEQIKKELTSKEEATIQLFGNYRPIPINRINFEKYVLNDDQLNLPARIQLAISDLSQQTHCIIHEVLLVGGSSQIPYIKRIILKSLENHHLPPESVHLSEDFTTSVAKGAAIQAALLHGKAIPPFRNNYCRSVVSRDIYIDCGQLHSTTPFVERGTSYPFTESKKQSIFIPHALSENVPIKLSEIIKKPDGTEVKKEIADYLYYLPIYYTGDEIQVEMNIDEAGLYQIQAKHILTNETVQFETTKAFSLSPEQMEAAATRVENMKDQSKK